MARTGGNTANGAEVAATIGSNDGCEQWYDQQQHLPDLVRAATVPGKLISRRITPTRAAWRYIVLQPQWGFLFETMAAVTTAIYTDYGGAVLHLPQQRSQKITINIKTAKFPGNKVTSKRRA